MKNDKKIEIDKNELDPFLQLADSYKYKYVVVFNNDSLVRTSW